MSPQIFAYLAVISPVATVIVLVLGIFLRDHHFDVRISELQSHMDARFDAMEARFSARQQAISG